MSKHVVVVGQGYVGLPLAMRVVACGLRVTGVDRDEHRVNRLSQGESYVEDVPSDQLLSSCQSGRYRVASDYRAVAGFDVAIITVPTPLREGVPDLSFICDAGQSLSRYLRPGALVVLESTSYPGTTEEVLGPLLEEGSGLRVGKDFYLGYSPERIDPSNTTWNLSNTPKVVAGVDARSRQATADFYGSIVDSVISVSSCQTAELTKLVENTFRHVNIALVNELAMFAGELGINVWEALDAAASKPFGYMRFNPGPGVGGHCLPIDPSYLSWRVKRTTGHSFRFVELANDVNDHMPEYVVRRVTLALNRRRLPVNGSRLLLLGLSYKRDTGDARESPAIRVAEFLLGMGADVRAIDPHVDPADIPTTIRLVPATVDEVEAADLVLHLTDHTDVDLSMLDGHEERILDTRNDSRLEGVERL